MKLRNSYIALMLIASLALVGSGCSSSQTQGEQEEVDAIPDATPEAADAASPGAEAHTDAVPLAGADQATAPEQDPARAEVNAPAEVESAAAVPIEATAPQHAEAIQPENQQSIEVAAESSRSGDSMEYRVNAGDTLMKIAFETYGDLFQWKKILEANHDKVTDPNRIPAGTLLKLEKPSTPVVIERNGEKYLIKLGDTLGRISDDVYGTTQKWKRLWENNRQMIRNPNLIFAGFYLYYSMTPEERQESERLKQSRAPAPLALAAPAAGAKAIEPAPLSPNRMPASNP